MARTTMKVAGCQMLVTNSVKANEAKIKAAIRRAADEGADFLLTPEGSLSGYRSSFEGKKVAAAVRRVAARAKRAGVGLLLGTCYKEKAKGRDFCYNQVRVYAPEGEYLGAHSKILRCSPLEMPGTGEMADYVEGTLRAFEWKRITFGVLICNDMWASPHCTTMPNPHLPLQLARMGARIIFHAINSGTDQRVRPFHESNVEIRARSLGIHIVEVNAAKPGSEVNARSGLVLPDGTRPEIVPPGGEQFFTCTIRP